MKSRSFMAAKYERFTVLLASLQWQIDHNTQTFITSGLGVCILTFQFTLCAEGLQQCLTVASSVFTVIVTIRQIPWSTHA